VPFQNIDLYRVQGRLCRPPGMKRERDVCFRSGSPALILRGDILPPEREADRGFRRRDLFWRKPFRPMRLQKRNGQSGFGSTTGERMRFEIRCFSVSLAAGIALLALPPSTFTQQPGASPIAAAVDIPDAPDAPQPQLAAVPVEAGAQAPAQQPASGQDQNGQPPATSAAPQQTPPAQGQPAQGGSSSQAPAQQPAAAGTPAQSPSASDEGAQTQEEKRRKAQEQLEQQEHQRVMGVMATFNTTTDKNALPLSPKQKFQLFFKSSTDPWPFLLAGVIAGIGQADDSEPPWGQGAQGYAKRFGAAYSDAFIGNFFGNAVLPSVMREDPRYFQKGTGSFTGRALWAAGSTVWCKRDNGKWGPNYANVAGNIIGSAISTAYKPASDRGVGDVITDGLTVSAEGIVGAEVIEFWPDIVRHYKRKHAEKLARQAAQPH